MLYTLLYIFYIIVVIALIINLLLSGVQPTKTLAWMIVIALIPVLGVVLYITFGLNRRKFKFIRLKKGRAVEQYIRQIDELNKNRGHDSELISSAVIKKRKLSRLIEQSSGFLPHAGNQLFLLEGGQNTFEAIFSALESAQHSIHVQYYLIEDGKLSERLLAILEKKAGEGVEVRLIYDGVGSRLLSRKYIRRLRLAGAEVYGFLPLRFRHLVTTVNYRNHRKIVVVDGAVGFTGGINVADKYIDGDELGRWYDTHIQLKGPAVNSLQAIFAVDWQFVSGQETLLSQPYFPEQPSQGSTCVQMVASGPDSDFAAVRQEYFSLINQADDYVYIVNPYVIPGDIILEALQVAALSGVDVRIMIPASMDNLIVKWTVHSYFQEFLEAGIRIYLFPNGFLHSKIIVVDDVVASVGTANLDMRSFEQNFEVNAVIYDGAIANQLKEQFLKDCQQSKELERGVFLNRPWPNKIKEGMAKVLSPVL